MDTTPLIIFIIAAFSLGALILMKRESIAPNMRRGLALSAVVLIAFAFILIVMSLASMGSS
ncbi:hypothetical protein [Paenibacillus beijingensis]|uniref:Signal transduction histidine kinase n=1 Tax=Paenibacillus beijingensis TaxID=1126833 RepID=A0A0D5NQ60_9BACL|nr:hypothetical protein [Paenibacillus beijingensis]AJY77396.1 signal transduction histidine kinase [Paenibacillus beijingensis]